MTLEAYSPERLDAVQNTFEGIGEREHGSPRAVASGGKGKRGGRAAPMLRVDPGAKTPTGREGSISRHTT